MYQTKSDVISFLGVRLLRMAENTFWSWMKFFKSEKFSQETTSEQPTAAETQQ